jgi:hypothetical protein
MGGVSLLTKYKALLEEYHRLIDQPGWWLGERDNLVRTMDRLWAGLSATEREAALCHAEVLYKRKLFPAGKE